MREALLKLAALGFVRIVPRAGIFVIKLSVKELLAMLDILAHLEGLCARLAARRIGADEGTRLRRIHEASCAAVENREAMRYAELNREFHELLYENCRNFYLVEQIVLTRNRTAAYRLKRFEESATLLHSREGHEKIMQAVLAGNGDGASAAAIEHITLGGAEFAEIVSRLPEEIFSNSVRPPRAAPMSGAFWTFGVTGGGIR